MSSAVPQLRFVRRVLWLVWFLLGVGLLAWIGWRNLPPSGILSASSRTAEPNGFIGGFTPLDRAKPVQEGERWYSEVVDEPVYFSLAAPRLYDTMRVHLRYKETDQPYVALGARTDLQAWNFLLKPIDLPMLDDAGWAARQEGELRIYQRRADKRSAGEILAAGTRVAVLALDPVRWSLHLPQLSDEKPVDLTMNEIGTRKFYVYVQRGPLELSLGLRGPEKTEAVVSLVRDGKTLLSRTHRGDGAVDLSLSGAEPGLYRVDIDAPDSVALVGVHSRQARLVFLDTGGEHLHTPTGAVAFDPEFPVVTWETDMKKAPYDAIIARYRPPTIDAEGWRNAEADFAIDELAVSQGRVQMILSLPAIKKVGGSLRVDRVTVDYVRPAFDLQRLYDLFKLKL